MATAYDPKEHGPLQLAQSRADNARAIAETFRREAGVKLAAAEKKEAEASYWQQHAEFISSAGWQDGEG